MQAKEFLMIPGPTPVPDPVLAAICEHPMAHRSKEFSQLLVEVIKDLKTIAECDTDAFVFTASGTAAMEAAIANTISPGDKVLSLISGVFGARFAKIAEAYGASVERLESKLGEPISIDALKKKLSESKDIKVVTVTHNETSTGVLNDLQAIAQVIHEYGALCVVDAVTSYAACPLSFSKWKIDIMVTGSQKALMLPPGLSFVFVSEKAWQFHAKSKSPKFYFDFARYRKSLTEDTTPFTPNVSFVAGLKTALDMIKKEGFPMIYARHENLQKTLRAGVLGMGLKLFVKDQYASPTITSIVPPEAISVNTIRQSLKEKYQIRVADGQEELKSKIFRIGHMGYIFERDILMTLACLEAVLKDAGYHCPSGIGVGSALSSI
jgi:aspartate aminotransferase-like enzyme